MNVNAIGALSAYTYQNTLAQTGSASQALSQALAASQSQADDMSSLLSSVGSVDPLTALSGSSGMESLSALTYASSAASGNGSDALQAMLGTRSPTSSLSSLFSGTDGLSMSAALLSPSTTEALVRYTYDQSQNHTASAAQTAAQAIASGQQTLMTSTLNLLA
jgi:hypothetical protein